MPAPFAQRLALAFNIIIVGALLIEHQTLLPNTKASIEKQINRLMDESAFVTSDTIETMQNDLHTLMEDARNTMMDHSSSTSSSERKKTSFKSSARACPPNHPPADESHFQSRNSKDRELLKWFDRLCDGSYIELGAHDGVQSSTSYVFNKAHNWRGILVEGSPQSNAQLNSNRPNELSTVHAGVCESPRDLHWVNGKAPDGGGFLEFASQRYKEVGFTPESIASAQVVKCQPLQTIIEGTAGAPRFFDFCSLAVAGGEYAALKSLDFEKVGFGMIVVEVDGGDERKNLAIRTLLEANGYTFLHALKDCYWFHNSDWNNIYGHLIYLQS